MHVTQLYMLIVLLILSVLQTICQQEAMATFSANEFFHLPKFVTKKLQRCLKVDLGPTIFFRVTQWFRNKPVTAGVPLAT